MNKDDKFSNLKTFKLWFGLVLFIWLAMVSIIVAVAYHFISKYW